MTSIVVCKSVFSIQPYNNKKKISIGFLVDNQITIVMLLECELTKQTLKLDQEKWNYLLSEPNYSTLLNGLYTHSKRTVLIGNIFYSINANNETITLRVDNSRITLTRYNLSRLKQLQHCVDACILTKQKQLHLYQTCFDLVLSLIKQDVADLPISCQKKELVNSYVQNYEFNLSNVRCEDKYFILELQQFHYEKISDMVLNEMHNKHVSI